LYLVYFEGFDNTETAKIIKKTKRQVVKLLYNAKQALKKELEKEGFEYEEL
jgi:RNA polymerase sigma-70 factor (ECF subfamily)